MSRHTLRRSVLGGLSALALLAPLAACAGGDTTSANDGGCDGVTVKAGVTGSLSDGMMFVARERGYFEDEGLDVEFTTFDSAAKMVPSLGSGQLDVGGGGPSAGLYNAAASGIDFRIVADKGQLATDHNYFPLMVRTDLVESGEVKSIADLKGLKVAESAQGASSAPNLTAILEPEGLTYNDVDHMYIGFADMVSAFQNGAIDAANLTEPTATVLEEAGAAVRFYDSTEVYPNQQIAVLLYNGDFAEKKKEAAQCFMNAYLNASKDFSAAVEGGKWEGPGAEEIAQIIADELKLPVEQITKTVPGYLDPEGRVNAESIVNDYRIFKDNGWLDGEVDPASLIDNSFVDAIAAAEEK
jgi:NitT/TauT family transport system substrate-binding protein